MKRVIALHDTPDAAALEKKLVWLKENYQIVSLERFFTDAQNDSQSHPEAKPKDLVLITLDDGYENWYSVAAPLLKQHNLPAVFFVCSGFLGQRRIPVRQRDFKPLTKEQLRELAQEPLFEIGGHTVNHPQLPNVWEIEEDKKRLEEITGKPIRYFAYPYGRSKNFNQEVKEIVRQAGYEAAFTIIPGFYKEGGDKFAIGRNSLDVVSPEKTWARRLSGRYDWLYRLKDLIDLYLPGR